MENPPDHTPIQDRILVVEDEPRLRHVWEQAIREMGYWACGVRTGEEALHLASQQEFGIAMLDMNLPGMSGMDVFRELRRRNPHLAVIIVTGYGTLENAREAIHLDVVEFLSKPAGLGELEVAIDRSRRRVLDYLEPAELACAMSEPVVEEAPNTGRIETMEEIERKSILAALERNQGNRTNAAKELGISLRTLHYRLSEYERNGFLT